MRIVLDTNVLISGTFWTGTSYEVIQLIDKGKVKIITSKEILEEYDRILHSDEILEKKAYQSEKMTAVLKLVQIAIFVEPKEKFKVVEKDPDDDKFIDAAVEGKAEYIITQDEHLLKLKEFRRIKIVKPEEFLETINTNK